MNRISQQRGIDFFLVIILFLLVFQLADFFKVFELPPRSLHQWRQCDGYSMAVNYYHENTPLLEPKVHFTGNREGKAVGEFPILYFVDAKLWQFFGTPSILVARLFHFSFFFLAITLLFRGISSFTNSRLTAFLTTLTLLVSPIILFYSNTTTPTIPAFSLIIMGWFFLYSYYLNQKYKWIILAICAFSFAGLLRVSMLIGLFAFAGAWLLMWLKKENRPLLQFKFWQVALITLIPVFIAIVWINFSKAYNLREASGLFLAQPLPYWKTENPAEIWDSFVMRIIPDIFSTWVLIFVLLALFIVLLNIRRLNRFLVYVLLFLLLQIGLYFILFFANFHVHDYYMIEFYQLIPIVALLFYEWFKNRTFPKPIKIITSVLICLILGQGLLYTSTKTRIKYNKKIYGLTTLFLNEKEIGLWKWMHFIYDEEMIDFETVTPSLREYGIKRTDRTVVISDESPNISLSLMDQKGISDSRNFENNIPIHIERWKNARVKYAVVNYPSKVIKQFEENGFFEKVGSYKHLTFYRIHFEKQEN